jgi:hypothetical protein
VEAFERRRPGRHPESSNARRRQLRRQKTEERRRRRTAAFMQEYLAYLRQLLAQLAEKDESPDAGRLFLESR